jgi:hypothetical protein
MWKDMTPEATDALSALIDEYEVWCRAQGLLQIDAMEQVLDPKISDEQRRWLSDFIVRWEAAERL